MNVVTLDGLLHKNRVDLVLGPEFILGDWSTHFLRSQGLPEFVDRETLNINQLESNYIYRRWPFSLKENLMLSPSVFAEFISDVKTLKTVEEVLALLVVVPSTAALQALWRLANSLNLKEQNIHVIAVKYVPHGSEKRSGKVAGAGSELKFSELEVSKQEVSEAKQLYSMIEMGEPIEGTTKYVRYGGWCTHSANEALVQKAKGLFSDKSPAVFIMHDETHQISSWLACTNFIGNNQWRHFGGPGLRMMLFERFATVENFKSVAKSAVEAIAFAEEKRVESIVEKDTYICDLCERHFECKDEPIRKFDNTYCSLTCLTDHRKSGWKRIPTRNQQKY